MTIKNICHKLEIHPLFWFVAASSLLTGLFKEFIVLFSIIVIHEIGHLLAAYYYRFNIDKINLYPFGGYIKFNDKLNRKINDEFMVLICGPLMQMIYFYIISFVYDLNYLNTSTYNMFFNYHYSLLLFNLLPIFPLDGSKLVHLILGKFISYKQSHLIMIYISYLFIFITLLTMQYINLNINLYFFLILLLFKLITESKNHKVIYNRFLLERYLYQFHFDKLKIIRGNCLSKMMRDKKHLFIFNHKEITEKEMLKKRFTKN